MKQRVERTIIRQNHPSWMACHRLCSQARKLGNCAAYILRHQLFDQTPFLSRKELDNVLKLQYPNDYRAMPSAASAQRQGQIIAKEFKSFREASKAYRKHPEKFTGKPQLPGYKTRYRAFVVGRNGYQITDGLLSITGGEEVGFQPLRVRCCQNQVFNAKAGEAVAGDLRIIAKAHCFIVELTYREEENKLENYIQLDRKNALVADLGVNNFATFVSTKPGVPNLLVKGGMLKSLNQKYNRLAAQLRSNGHYEHIRIKGFKRYRQISDVLHKTSRTVINYCVAHDLGVLVIGVNKYWKQEVQMGKRNNQNFVMLPHSAFIEMLKYKAQDYGIEVIVREESYTSKASALDFDVVPNYGEKVSEGIFSGNRIQRGLYRSGTGRLINADINGAINIARKEFGDEWLRKRLGLDEGVLVNTPVVIRRLHVCADVRTLLEVGARPYETECVSAR